VIQMLSKGFVTLVGHVVSRENKLALKLVCGLGVFFVIGR